HVPSQAGSNPGIRESARCRFGEFSRLRVWWPELRPVPIPLLEVVGDDLFVFGEPIAGHSAEPVGEACMELCSRGLWHRLVSGVADQQVPEAVCLFAGELGTVRSHQLLTRQGQQLNRELAPLRLRNELRDSATVEDLALHRTALENCTLG